MNQQLTPQQMRRVTTYLKKRGIADEGLLQEMAEHIKGLVTLYVGTGSDFEAAFLRAVSVMKAREMLTGFPARDYAGAGSGYRDKMLPVVMGAMALLILLTGLYLQYHALPFGHLLLITGFVVLVIAFIMALGNLLTPLITVRFHQAFRGKKSMI